MKKKNGIRKAPSALFKLAAWAPKETECPSTTSQMLAPRAMSKTSTRLVFMSPPPHNRVLLSRRRTVLGRRVGVVIHMAEEHLFRGGAQPLRQGGIA
jgi:hypothetical protein